MEATMTVAFTRSDRSPSELREAAARPQRVGRVRPAHRPRHVGLDPGFVDEDQLGGIQLGLLVAPFAACRGNINTVLLGGAGRLFLRVRPSRASVSQIRPLLAETWCVCRSQTWNSPMVASGCFCTRARIAS
jgi:hypothetical protein